MPPSTTLNGGLMIRSVATCLLLTVAFAAGTDIRHHRKSETVKVRISAVAEQIHQSGFSPNRDAILVELIGRTGPADPAKLLFRYLGYEEGLPEDLVNYDLIHTFKVIRDTSCDETWHSFSTKTVVDSQGVWVTSDVVRFTSANAMHDMLDDQVLPCYVTEARGYRGSTKSPITVRLAESNIEGR